MNERPTGPGWPMQPAPPPPPPGWGPLPPMGAPGAPPNARPTGPSISSSPPPGPVPARPPREPWPSEMGGRRRRGDRGPGAASLVVGGVFILTGVWLLLREFAPELEPSRFWPLAIVALGLVLLLASLASRARGRGGDRG